MTALTKTAKPRTSLATRLRNTANLIVEVAAETSKLRREFAERYPRSFYHYE